MRELIANRASEELYLDYKRSANNGRTTSLDPNDRATLAKAISGFANSAGGIIIWGIDCRPRGDQGDTPVEHCIENVARFRSLIEAASTNAVVPAHRKVVSLAIPLDSQAPSEAGFVATFIPISDDAPHQVPDKGAYFIRAGSSFVPTPHAVLAGMFGRRPQPGMSVVVINQCKLKSGSRNPIEHRLGLVLKNAGRGIARDIFANVTVSLPGPNCQLGLDEGSHSRDWITNVAMGRFVHIICKPEVRIAPGGMQMPVQILFILCPPFDASLRLSWLIGCDGGVPFERELVSDIQRVTAYYTHHVHLPDGSDRTSGPSLIDFESTSSTPS